MDSLLVKGNSTFGVRAKPRRTAESMRLDGGRCAVIQREADYPGVQDDLDIFALDEGNNADEQVRPTGSRTLAEVRTESVRELGQSQEYFTEMGEAISNEIEAISDHLQRQLPKNLEFMDRLGQMNMIWYQAEEAVLGELVYSVETETDVYEELSDLLGQLPPPDLLDQHLEALEDAMEREADGGVGRSKFRSRSGSEQELGGEDSAPIDRREPGGSDDRGASQGSPISAPEPSRAREQLVNERVRPGAPLPSCCRDRRVGHRRRVGLLVDDRWSGHGWVRGRIR